MTALAGNYVDFGVFEIYGDRALSDALDVALKMTLSIPLTDILAFHKGLLILSYRDFVSMIQASLYPYINDIMQHKNVQTANVSLNASDSEESDFLLYDIGGEKHVDGTVKSIFENVKIPIFVVFALCGEDTSFTEASNLLKLGASGLVISLEVLELFGDVMEGSEGMDGIVGVGELIDAWVELLKVGKKVDILRPRKRRIERDGFERNECVGRMTDVARLGAVLLI
ncbi:hypothetical protein SO802_000307 [Lithocarpus litseifolius]|uniref:Indole-3-glycerol-phosphate synthase n=1 Tax=Lithocarpus litseifolius TaxID=425828 RepID=A0AAW2DUM7_9ROSI